MKRSAIDDVSSQVDDHLDTVNDQAAINHSIDSHLNIQNLSDSENSEAYTMFDPQPIYKNFVKKLSSDNRKMFAVLMIINRLEYTLVSAAKESGILLGVNEKTVRNWRRDFYENNGTFTTSRQGKHTRPFVLDDEDCRQKASQWVRSNASVKRKPNMTASKFAKGVNEELLPNSNLPENFPKQIQERTAVKWLHQLGFRPQSHKKGIYIDGHE